MSSGPEQEVTTRNTTFITWNLMHLAAMLKRNGGIPAWDSSAILAWTV